MTASPIGGSALLPMLARKVVPGDRLGCYEIVAPLASGGMAEIWVAERRAALGVRRLVALKTMRPELAATPGARSMFIDEARIAARIRHANVVDVLDLGRTGAWSTS